MMKFSFPLASSDPFRSQKLARLWERSGSSVEAATQLEKKALEEEVEVKVTFNSKGQDAGKGGGHGADHVIFQELLTVAELVTMNVHDLYFGEPRDKRRGLFLLHKLLLKNKQQPKEEEFLEVERKMKSPAECAGGCGGAAGRGNSRSDGDMEVDDAGPPGAGDIRGEDVEDGGQEPQEHLEALQRICQDAVNRYCEHEKDAGAGADEPSEMLNLKAGEGEMNCSASKIALRPVPLPVDLATTTATEVCSFGRPQIYVHPELRVGETERDGFGLYADGAIAPNSDVLKIPHPHVLNAINAFRDPDFRPFYEKLREQECDEEKIAMAYLIFLRKKFLQSRSSSGGGEQESVGNGNFRSATVTESHPLHFLVTKCLPADLDACPATLLQWPEEALENLYCPQLLYQVETQRMETNEFYSKLQQVFAEQDAPAADDSCTFDRGTSGIFTLDFDEVLYAKTIFDSRAFQLDVVVGEEVPLQESCHEDGDSTSSGDVEMDVAGDEQQAAARCDNNDVDLDKKMFGDGDEDEEDVRNMETNEEVENECGTMLSTSKRAQLIDGELFPEVRVTCLVPVADFLNHDRKSPLGVPRFERVVSPEDEPSFVLTTAASFGTSTTSTSMSGGRTATQLTLNYGPLQNWELLFYYGFCFERNGADTLQLELGESDDAEQMLLLNLHEVTTDHVLAFPRPKQELLQGEEMQQGAPHNTSSGKKIRWPLAPKLLICLRVFHGVATADLNDCTWEKGGGRGECDLQICDVLLEEVFGNLLIPEEDELLATVMTATNRMWDAHPVYGLLAKRFRESQRKLVRANIQALENFKEQILGEMATKCKTVGGGGSAKKKRGGKRR